MKIRRGKPKDFLKLFTANLLLKKIFGKTVEDIGSNSSLAHKLGWTEQCRWASDVRGDE